VTFDVKFYVYLSVILE